MKTLLLFLLVLCASVSAELVYSNQEYMITTVYDTYSILRGSIGGGWHWVCDDFILEYESCRIDSVVIWTIWEGEQAYQINLVLSDDMGDSDPNTAVTVWEQLVFPTYENTGDVFNGYYIYRTTCPIGHDWPVLTGGTTYWLEVDAIVYGEENACYAVSCHFHEYSGLWYDEGSGVFVSTGNTDMYMEIYGEETGTLTPCTWGEIKTRF